MFIKQKKSNNKRILVTGANGFIAGYVIEELQRRGYTPIGLARSHRSYPHLEGVEMYYGDVRDETLLTALAHNLDGVIHTAALLGTGENMSASKQFVENNIIGGLNVVEMCNNYNIPLTYISVGNYSMNNPYSITKTTIERFMAMAIENGFKLNKRVNMNIVRALNAFGPRQKISKIRKIIPTFINAALKNEPLYVYGGKEKCSNMDMVYVADVASILVDRLESMNEKTFEFRVEAGTGKAYPVYEIAEKIIELTKSKSEIVETPMRLGEPEKSTVKSENPYEFNYTDFEQALKKTIEYYKNAK